MARVESANVLVETNASNYAYTLGQTLESVLIDAAIAKACSQNRTSVSRELVEQCLDDVSIGALLSQLDESEEKAIRAA